MVGLGRRSEPWSRSGDGQLSCSDETASKGKAGSVLDLSFSDSYDGA